MNIARSQSPFEISAKSCSCHESEKEGKITYLFLENYHSLCLDKKEMLLGEINACERLLKNAFDETEKEIIERELADLRLMLDLL
jgi:hypothetical protein